MADPERYYDWAQTLDKNSTELDVQTVKAHLLEGIANELRQIKLELRRFNARA